MVLKKWMGRRRERKESQQRFEKLSEEEVKKLQDSEKAAYLEVAKKQVTYRGKINAYKDFPVEKVEKQFIKDRDSENKKVNEFDNEAKSEEQELLEQVPKIEPAPMFDIDKKVNKEVRPKNVYKTIRQV